MISIIIPCYNCEPFIKRCLLSIFEQTYKDFEIICVNDGSSDNSLKILNSFKEKIILINQSNKGQGFARNVGLNVAKGEYICFVDSDDYLNPLYLEKLIGGIKDSDLCVCNFTNVDKTNEYSSSNVCTETCSTNRFWELNMSDPVWAVVPWNKLYKASLLKSIRFPNGKYYEDEFFLTEVIRASKKINVISDSLYFYYQNSSGTMKTNNVYRKLDRVEARNIRCDYLLDNEVFEPFKFSIRENLFLLLRIKDLAKKHHDIKKHESKINNLAKDIRKIISRSVDLKVHNNLEVFLFAKIPLVFYVIYFFRKIIRTILKRNYENA